MEMQFINMHQYYIAFFSEWGHSDSKYCLLPFVFSVSDSVPLSCHIIRFLEGFRRFTSCHPCNWYVRIVQLYNIYIHTHYLCVFSFSKDSAAILDIKCALIDIAV